MGRKGKDSDFHKIISNFSWLFVNKVINIVSGLMISVVITRYLGAANNGIVNYVTAFVSMFSVFALFGLQNIVIKEFAGKREPSGKIACTAAGVSAVGSLIAFLLSVGTAWFFQRDKYFLYILVQSISFLTYPLLILEYWFIANSKAKYYTIIQNTTYLASLLAKLLCVMLEKPVIYFVVLTAAETMLMHIGLLVAYKVAKVRLTKLSFSKTEGKHLVRTCWPLMFATLAASIYMKCDQLMIGSMLGEYDLGIYSVAVRLSEYWYFLPGAIYTSCLPIISKHFSDKEQFGRKLQGMSDILAILGYCAAIGFMLFSRPVVQFLYGSEYLPAAGVMVIYIWAGLFVSLGNVKLTYCTLNEYSKIQFAFTVVGALLNIGLNFVLIPKMGIKGATIATVVTQALTTWFGCLFVKRVRPVFAVETKSILFFARPKDTLASVKAILNR